MIERLGWTLIHFLWQGAAVAAVAWLASATSRDARVRYGIGCAALLAMVVLPPVTFSLLGGGQPAGSVPSSLEELLARPAADAAGSPLPPVGGAAWMVWVVWAWALGVSTFSVRLAGGWMLAVQLTRHREPVPEPWRRKAEAAAARLGFRGALRLFASARVEVPMVVGYLRPLILVPAGALVNLPAAQMEAVLAHEIAHILRRDPLVNLLQTIAETLLFYHPAIWWLSARIRDERENCCDDLAVRACGTRRIYAEALLALEQGRGAEPALVLSARGGGLRRRVARLLLPNSESPRHPLPALLALLSVLAMAGFTARTVVALKGAEKPPQPAPKPAPVVASAARQDASSDPELSPRFKQWLIDVEAIIAPEELNAFHALGHDAERDHFIQQFWERRNPNPGSAENSFKTEHYRRLAYANARFGSSSVAGARTPRGRLYINAGPPDEIESHPAEGREAWRYRNLEGFGQVTWTFDLRQGKVVREDEPALVGKDAAEMQRRSRKLRQLQVLIDR